MIGLQEYPLVRPSRSLRHPPGKPAAMTLVAKDLFRPTPTFRARRKRMLVRVQIEGGEGDPARR